MSPYPGSSRFSLVFSSRSFHIFAFSIYVCDSFRVIFFRRVNFVYSLCVGSFYFLLMDIQSPEPFVEKTPLLLRQRSVGSVGVLFLGFLPAPLTCSSLLPVTTVT